jgi:hypothetical protein
MQWAGMDTYTASTWVYQHAMFLFSAQLKGGGGNEEFTKCHTTYKLLEGA